MPDVATSPSQRRAGISVHLLTASGVIAGFLALQSVNEGHVRAALLWLIVTIVLDGVDGPIARRFDVKIHAPNINGYILDLVIDYVTCVVVPVALMIHAEVVPTRASIPIAALILVSSALWFARTDQETDDAWFNGFPAMWSIVIPALVILGTSQMRAVVICSLFSLLQLTNIKFPHVVRVRAFRRVTYSAAILYFGAFCYLCIDFPGTSTWARSVLLVGPAYLFALVVWRTWFPHRCVRGWSITPVPVPVPVPVLGSS